MGGDGTQDGAVDPEDEKSDTNTNAVELCRVGDSSSLGYSSQSRHPRDLLVCTGCFFQFNHFHCRSSHCIYYNRFRAQGRAFLLNFGNVTLEYSVYLNGAQLESYDWIRGYELNVNNLRLGNMLCS